ncbi:MAG TPA: VOC family protein [Gaiellaceae bacterium]|nr:VOC family protein [Gaiellaceae bacterium]
MAATPLITGVDFVSVATKDIGAAIEFYGTVLGLPHTVTYGKSPGVEFETGSLTLQILQSEAFGMTFQTDNHPIAFQVDDVAAARAELESRGVEFKGDILDSGVCHMAFFEDPDGNALMLHHRYAPRTPAG